MNTRPDPNDPPDVHRDPISPSAETKVSATDARQGRPGFPVLKVLVAGIVLAFIAWGVAEIWGQASEPPAEQAATPPAGDTTPAPQEAEPSADPAAPPVSGPATGETPAN